MLELYEATYNPVYLKKALKLNNAMFELFKDNDNSGLFLYGNDSEQLISRPKECYDGAIPSGNSVAVMNLLRIARITGRPELEKEANSIMRYFGSDINDIPMAHTYMLCGYLYSITDRSSEVVIVGSDCNEMLKNYNSIYHPFTVSISNITPELIEIIPNAADYNNNNTEAAAYICRNFSCMPPITDTAKLKDILS